uniref:Uncharacterized protein n=1 Tax=Rhizophora mucronata TaxID=61149 RepID=A0A2P2NNV0_RHIMU
MRCSSSPESTKWHMHSQWRSSSFCKTSFKHARLHTVS